MRTRKSTAILLATWIATFVLYLIVKPDHAVFSGPELVVNTKPAVENSSP
ncbi:hypothetical protein [Nocardia arthritidis]|uniref:Uncharacterized protein n=1 Tax=Nocardia arthritidis TaxID=228602 RepID=A0A6G9YP24_9NOCA|nr:hypothetical protein [Nocardia arthritidis]QIS15049.1 hypothetical protein F5544_36100 [Nocardia arthritidis]